MKEVRISVVVPIYNVETSLERCVNSIQAQSYSKLEIILVDDGSPDASGQIADRLAMQDDRIRVIHKENGGLSDARNAGIEVATGEYICFVDSDDMIEPSFVERLLRACTECDADIAICEFASVSGEHDIDEVIKSNKVTESEHAGSRYVIQSNIEALDSIYSAANVSTVVAWNKLYKSELWNGVRFPVGRIHEDEATTFRLLYKAARVVRVSNALYFYFKNDEGITGSRYSLRRLDILKAIEDRMEFYRAEGLDKLYYKDSYKYLCKLLTSYYQVAHMDESNTEVKKELRCKYNDKLKECLAADTGWSMKRKLGLRLFALMPLQYARITGKR